MKKFLELLDLFKRSLIGGFFISLAYYVYLVCDNAYIGSLLFSLVIMIGMIHSANLFPIYIGYAEGIKSLGDHLIILIGNIISISGLSFLIKQVCTTEIIAKINNNSSIVFNQNNIHVLLILGVIYGMISYLSMSTFLKTKYTLNLLIPIFILIFVFKDYCITKIIDMIVLNKVSSLNILKILILIITFSLGARLMHIITTIKSDKEKED